VLVVAMETVPVATMEAGVDVIDTGVCPMAATEVIIRVLIPNPAPTPVSRHS